MLVEMDLFTEFTRRYIESVNIIESQKNLFDRIDELNFNKEYKYLKQELEKIFNISFKDSNIKEILNNKYQLEIKFLKNLQII